MVSLTETFAGKQLPQAFDATVVVRAEHRALGPATSNQRASRGLTFEAVRVNLTVCLAFLIAAIIAI